MESSVVEWNGSYWIEVGCEGLAEEIEVAYKLWEAVE